MPFEAQSRNGFGGNEVIGLESDSAKLLSFKTCVCVCGGGGVEGQRERETGQGRGEKEKSFAEISTSITEDSEITAF